MAPLVKLASCNLNQWAMDFKGNLARIEESVRVAKAAGCTFRTGPELEITGYSCEDYFHEQDTFDHAADSLALLLKSDLTDGILCDFGLPMMHRNVAYNCRVVCLDRKILGVRPKFFLANDGNYREMRYFTPWYIAPDETGFGPLQDLILPEVLREATGQLKVPIGIFAVTLADTVVGFETCEELFTPNAPNILFSLDGVEIIANGSGSHHKLRKLNTRIDLCRSATAKSGGIYLYANQKGCDGQARLYFDGCAMIWVNGEMVAQGSQFEGLDEVEVIVATCDLADVRSKRANFIARSFQASSAPKINRIDCTGFKLADPNPLKCVPSVPMPPKIHHPMEEIALGPSGWLWDYLRRTGMRGYFLPLSGGADSSSTATMVAIMCQRVVNELTNGSERSKKLVLADVRRVTKRPNYTPSSWRDLCGKLFVTCYMASKFSGSETRDRAALLATQIGALHTSIYIDKITDAIKQTFKEIDIHAPFVEQSSIKTDPQITGGTSTENLALQNIQARSRMVMSYFLAQLMPWATDGDQTTAAGGLLVLGSANVDEALRGYYTKYDCSAADINPIGGVNKRDLKAFLMWASSNEESPDLAIPVLKRVAEAQPSAELTGAEGVQSDEVDMGMSYDELGDLGTLRKLEHCGPLSTFLKLRDRWNDGRRISGSIRATGANAPKTHDEIVAQKVKDFYFYHAINRHKMTTLTPSYHAEDYSPDDNRFDLRPFLQNVRFEAQFEAIDKAVAAAAAAEKGGGNGSNGKRKR